MTEHAPDLSVTEARQARRGKHAFVILIVSTGLVVVALAIVWAFSFGPLSHKNGNKEAPAVAARSLDQPVDAASQMAAEQQRAKADEGLPTPASSKAQ